MKRGALGKGLDALIPPAAKKDGKGELRERMLVPISKIQPNRKQPRQFFDEDALEDLAESIKQHGVLEPLLVRDMGSHYDIIFGERRWRAARKAGLKEVPAMIMQKDELTEQQIVEIQLIENLQREDINPIEEAQAFERLIREFHMKQDEVAEKVSKSRVYVTNSLRLLKLCPPVQQMVIENKLQTGHARALIPVENAQEQFKIAERIFDERLSVREAERIVRQMDTPARQRRAKKKNEALEASYRELEERVREAIGTRVSIQAKGAEGAGLLEIEFYSGDDLERITDRLMLRA